MFSLCLIPNFPKGYSSNSRTMCPILFPKTNWPSRSGQKNIRLHISIWCKNFICWVQLRSAIFCGKVEPFFFLFSIVYSFYVCVVFASYLRRICVVFGSNEFLFLFCLFSWVQKLYFSIFLLSTQLSKIITTARLFGEQHSDRHNTLKKQDHNHDISKNINSQF